MRCIIWATDPFDSPVINPNFLEDEDDVSVIVEGALIALKALNTGRRYKELDARLVRTMTGIASVDARKLKPYSKAWLKEDVRAHTFTVYHPVGTVAMGEKAEAPCTPEFKVRGVKNLRVVDCSSFPHLPSGNTNAPAMLLGEIAAQMLRGEAVRKE